MRPYPSVVNAKGCEEDPDRNDPVEGAAFATHRSDVTLKMAKRLHHPHISDHPSNTQQGRRWLKDCSRSRLPQKGRLKCSPRSKTGPRPPKMVDSRALRVRPARTSEFRSLERTRTKLAENEQWLAHNADKILPASEYGIVPTSEYDPNTRAVLVKEDEVPGSGSDDAVEYSSYQAPTRTFRSRQFSWRIRSRQLHRSPGANRKVKGADRSLSSQS
jgi:hypothetical protein